MRARRGSSSGCGAAVSRVGGAAAGTAVAGSVPPPFSSALGCASPTPGFPPPCPAAGARTADRATGERDVLTLRSPLFVFTFKNTIIFATLFLRPFRSRVFAGDKDSSAPPGKPEPCGCASPGPVELTRSGFIDSRLLLSSLKQPGLVPARIANCREH